MTNFSVIDEAPLQIYSSTLVFAPERSIIRQLNMDKIPSWLLLYPQVKEDWDACLSVLEGHSDWVSSVAFSHDSKIVASASHDKTVRIWNTQTGKCEQVLEGHSDWVSSVAFSHDSKIVASASGDKTVRIWNTQTGQCEEVISVGHDTRVLSFKSKDGSIVINHGNVSLSRKPALYTRSDISPQSSEILKLGLRGDSWITKGGKDLFWLPAECRGARSVILGNTVVIGCHSGRMVVLRFSAAEVAEL